MSAPIDSIELWRGELTTDAACYADYWRMLDQAEQIRAGRITTDLLHKRYVEVHGRLRKVLAQTLAQPPEKIRIEKSEYGKPYLADHPHVSFNLSHSANYLLIAIGRDCRLGVDIEVCKSRTSLSSLVGKCFAEEESAYWNNLPEAEKVPQFYRFWTRKEAFVKATGRGIALGLEYCVIDPGKPTAFLRVPPECGPASQWRVLDIEMGQGICSAIVADKPLTGIRLMDLGDC